MGTAITSMDRQDIVDIFSAAVASVHPAQLLPAYLSVENGSIKIGSHVINLSTKPKIYVIGAGKASAAMAVVTENILGDLIYDGIVVAKRHHSLPYRKIKIIEAAHPVPDEMGIDAVKETLDLLSNVTEHDIVICLLSGGASALWCDLPEGIQLNDIQTMSTALINSGATISEMNIVRKHLSSIKGGQLLRYCMGAKIFTLAISDVPDDLPEVIASGPTVADPSTFAEAIDILRKFSLFNDLPENIRTYLDKGINGINAETIKFGDQLLDNAFNILIANNQTAINAAANRAMSLGYKVELERSQVIGETTAEAISLFKRAMRNRWQGPLCIIWGGETTIRVTGTGMGGRNQHFVLSALKELKKIDDPYNITILSGGTDGTDGPTEAAGAIADCNILIKAAELNLSIDKYLDNHDAYHFFKQTNGLIITGATQTNVMDIMIAIVK